LFALLWGFSFQGNQLIGILVCVLTFCKKVLPSVLFQYAGVSW